MKEIQILRAEFQNAEKMGLEDYTTLLQKIDRDCKKMNIDKALIFMCDIGFYAISSRNKINEFQYDSRTLKTPIFK
jgi:hypothetical protein